MSTTSDEFTSACMAMFTLGCRIGTDVCANVEAVELVQTLIVPAVESLLSGDITQPKLLSNYAVSTLRALLW